MEISSIPLTAAASSPPLSPPLAVLKPYHSKSSYVSYKDDQTAVLAEEEGVFNPRAKIAVETAKKVESGKTFVHLRCCFSNRYIGRREGSVIPIAELKQPDEDTTKTTSTLFELRHYYRTASFSNYFCHVQSQQFLIINGALDTLEINDWTSDERLFFQIVDWDSLVKMPQYVAFKGSNGSYLRGYSFKGHPYLQFSSDDPNSEDSMHEVVLQSDGHVEIKSLYFSGNYWRNSDFWIWADTQVSSTTDKSNLFWPVKLDDATITLRSKLNDQFCVNLTADDTDNCLGAHSPTITTDAHLGVQELVSNRKLYNVRYRMADARIFNERPYTAGSTTADNDTDEEASVAVSLTYTDSTSYTFANSTSLTAGVTATISADLLKIVNESVKTSIQVTDSFESGKTTTTEKSITATGTVTVPPKTCATVYYVGTLGTCDVPFSYTRQDKSFTDGSYSYTGEDDGIYTGVNAYNFRFTFDKPAETL